MIEPIFRINLPYLVSVRFLIESPFVWRATITKPEEGYGAYYSQWDDTGINTTRLVVGSFFVEGVSFNQKLSLADCESDVNSFFWNNVTQTLYAHYPIGTIPSTASFVIGILGGFSKNDVQYIDGVEYQPRIKSIGAITKKVDPFNVGKMAFPSRNIQLGNEDAGLDGFITEPVPGAVSTVAFYDTETEEILDFYAGRIAADNTTLSTLGVKLNDIRQSENITIPFNRFTEADYPDASDDVLDKLIPEGYGPKKGALCFALNEEEAGSPDIVFKFATDATAITTVYVKIDDDWKVKTPIATDAAAGEFTMARADVVGSGNTSTYQVRANVTLRSQTNNGDITVDMNLRYQSRSFDASNYDTASWASESAKLSDNGSLYMDKPDEFFKWIERLQKESDLFWLYTVLGDGRRNMRVDDPNRTPILTLDSARIKTFERPVSRNFEQFASSVTVEYDLDARTKRSKRAVNTDHQEQVIRKYGFPQDETLPSLLTVEADADLKAAIVAEDWSESRPIVKLSIEIKELSDLELELYDIIIVDLSLPEESTLIRTDVFTSDSESPDTFFIDSTATDSLVITPNGRQIDKAGREYWGEIRMQIIEIGFDIDKLDINIVGRERPESAVI